MVPAGLFLCPCEDIFKEKGLVMCLRSIDKFALCALFCGAFASGAFAYPSNPVLRTVDNDGDSLSIRTIGDEHYRFTDAPFSIPGWYDRTTLGEVGRV